jgi:microcystin-dependent protein
MSDQYLGEIRPAGFNFAPYGWALCLGQILPIQQYAALFSLLGTQFGGNGTSNFGLPNLQGNVLVGQGSSTTGGQYVIGEQSGTLNTSVLNSNMPIHTHPPVANSNGGASTTPTASIWATEYDLNGLGCTAYVAPPANVVLPFTTLAPVGGNIPLSVEQPNIAVNYIIALEGVFPARS